MKSKIEIDTKTENKYLMVPYESDNFNQAIDAALAYHGIKKGEMVVIAIPKRIPGGRMEGYPSHGCFILWVISEWI